MLTAPKATLSILAERTKINPWGLNGGEPGALGEYMIVKRNGEILKLPSKCTVQMEEGDSLIVHTPGGGGFGDPKKRTPEKIKRDIANGLLSVEAALRIYGIKTHS
jgi:N-methylhydantoinase B